MINLDVLWKKVQNGDSSSFGLIYKEFYSGMCHYAFQLLNDKFLAEETVHDIFLRIWELRDDIFSHGNSLKTYLYRLVHNQCIDILKHRKTKKAGMVRLLASEAWVAISEKYGFDEYMIERLETEETTIRIEKAVEKLPQQCRDIFQQSRIGGKTNEEIAGQMGISVNTVRTQIYRAIQKIKEEIYLITIVFLYLF